jgi:photosystem II stability/assembly factor-like uncharacterized protein
MMRIKNLLIAIVALICVYSIQSCKKSDTSPTAAVKADTLSTGWTRQVIAGETGLADIFFNSATTGYLIGSKIYKSTDGGATWNVVSPTAGLINIFVTNDSKAFFVQSQGSKIYKTIDGGVNFSNMSISDQPYDIYFVDNLNGYCIALNGLYATNDGGISWSRVTTTGLPSISGYNSLYCFNNATGWIVSYDAGIFRSTGTLTGWQPSVVSGSFSNSFSAVYATSATVVYAVNYSGQIFKSTNGGANFSLNKQTDIAGYMDIHFATDQIGYVSGGRFVYKTTDAGANWTKVVSIGEGNLGEVHFTDVNHGWVCENNGSIFTFKQ